MDDQASNGDDAPANDATFMSALVTEHFALQGAASTTVSESAARASLYMVSLSSSLIALGFAAQSPALLVPFVAAIVPAIFLLGVFSVVRLVDTGVQNVELLSRIATIRAYYRTLSPQGPTFFRPWGIGAGAGEALATMEVRRSWLTGLFTTASMVAAVNSIVAGTGVALAVTWIATPAQKVVAILLGLVVAAACMAAFLAYQDRRYKAMEAAMTAA
jgi:hypothetical protein